MVKRFFAPLLVLLMGAAITAQTIPDSERDGLKEVTTRKIEYWASNDSK